MNKPIAIIAGEPNSISSEIIFKDMDYLSHGSEENITLDISTKIPEKIH